MRRGWVLLYLNTPTSEVVLCGPNWGRLNTERAAVAFAIRRWACNRRKRKRPSGPRLEGSQTVYASMQVPTAVVVGAAAGIIACETFGPTRDSGTYCFTSSIVECFEKIARNPGVFSCY